MLKAAPALWDIQTKEYRDRNLESDETVKIDCFDTLNRYIRLVNESPAAKYRKVTANRVDGGIAAR